MTTQHTAHRTTTFGPAQLAGDITGLADERPPLVLLHGLTFDRSMWRPALDALGRGDPGRHALALDLPGHGDSPEQASYDLEAVADEIALAVADAGMVAPIIVGHSISAVIATIYASRRPTRGVVNVDQPLPPAPFAAFVRARAHDITGPGFPDLWEKLLASMHIDGLAPSARNLVRSTSRPLQHVVIGYWREALERPVEEITDWMTRRLATLRANATPYLIISGRPVAPAYQQWLHDALPQAVLTDWPTSGHFPHLADPDRFATLLATTGRWDSSSQPKSNAC